MQGWCKPKKGAEYADVCIRTFRSWLKNGLKHSRLGPNSVLVKYKHIDEYLEQFEENDNKIDQIVNSVLKEIKNG